MRPSTLALAFAIGAGSLVAGAADAASLEVKDAVARLTVIPENRSDTKIEIISSNPKLPITVRTAKGRSIIDGRLGNRIRDCSGSGEGVRVRVSGVGDVAWRDIPQIVVRTPRDVDIDAGGAVWGTVGRSTSLSLGNAGCGAWVVGNVEGPLRLSQAGSGGTRVGSAGTAMIRVAGSGDANLAAVQGPVEVDIAGSGDVNVASVSGPLSVKVAGSGDVRVAGGRASSMTAVLAGSGDVEFAGVADSLKASILGSGGVRAHQVRGAVSKTIIGAGHVVIGKP